MADSSLQAIRNKVRLLTRSPSTAQLTDAALDEYVNTFIAYDFPEHLRTFKLRTQFTFFTSPGQDTYNTDTISFAGAINNPLYDFQNIYLTVHDPVYIAGFPAFFSQSREQFFGIYPMINSIASIGTPGDGITTTFTGVVNSQQALIPAGFNQLIGLLQNQVLFDSIDSNGQGLSLIDVPVVDAATGNNTVNGNLYIPGFTPATPPTVVTPTNTINYLTGVFTITFPNPPAANAVINSQTVPQNLTLPQSLLYFNNKFTVRPVPDQPYRVNFEVYIRPTQLLVSNQNPDLNEYWQYIAYGASKKIFEDRMDMESVQLIMPEFKKQENLVNRRTIVQNTNERVATIYTEQTTFGSGAGAWWWGSGPF
jgi:hypothetical protein